MSAIGELTGYTSSTYIDSVLNSSIDKSDFIYDYLTHRFDISAIRKLNVLSSPQIMDLSEKVVETLLDTTVSEIIQMLRKRKKLCKVVTDSIPQYSNLTLSFYLIPIYLYDNPSGYDFTELGKQLHDCASDDAARKYGENHGKVATQIDLAEMTIINRKKGIKKGNLCDVFHDLQDEEKDSLLQRLCIRIPIIQHAVICRDPYQGVERDILLLSGNTQDRRRRNIREIIDFVMED